MINTPRYKTAVATICGFIVLVGAYAPSQHTTPHAHAFFGDIALATKELVTDPIFWMVARTATHSITQSIVNWINSGFEGSPAFVTDLEQNLSNLGDAVAEDFFRGLDEVIQNNTGFSIRAPFQDQINRALRDEYYRTTSSYGFNVRNPYQDCYRGQGFSFNGFFCESQDPANNAFGRYQLARNELFSNIDKETQNRLRDLDAGRMFQSWRGPCELSGRPGATPQTGGTVSLSTTATEKNRKCPIRTPGAVIEESLGITVNSPLRQLELADEFNEILFALMSQMTSQVFGGGGLSGLSQPTSGGGPSYIDRLGSSNQSTGTTGTIGAVLATITQARTEATSYRASWQRIAGAANAAEQACRSTSRAAEASAVAQTANANVAKANKVLSELAEVEAKISAAGPNVSLNDSAAHATEFQTILATDIDAESAKQASQDTGNTQPGSIYSQMVRLEQECR